MTQKMIFSKELNMMLVPMKVTCPECKGTKFAIDAATRINSIKKYRLVYPDFGKVSCPSCEGKGFYTINHL